MFQVGQCISYPMHGAGRVEALEKHEVMGELRLYYVLFFYCDGIKVMVPVERAESVGLREVISPEDVPAVLERLCSCCEEETMNWNRRYRQNLDKLREGGIMSIAEVVKSLSVREKRRGLSAGEKKMLSNARRFLLGELFLSGGGTEDMLNQTIDECLNKGIEQEEADKKVEQCRVEE